MSNQLEMLQQALKYTEQMLLLAEQEQWSQLTEMQIQRTPILETVFPLDSSNIDAVRPVLEKIIELNQQVEQRCRDARQQIQTELSGFNKNKKAATAYLSN